MFLNSAHCAKSGSSWLGRTLARWGARGLRIIEDFPPKVESKVCKTRHLFPGSVLLIKDDSSFIVVTKSWRGPGEIREFHPAAWYAVRIVRAVRTLRVMGKQA